MQVFPQLQEEDRSVQTDDRVHDAELSELHHGKATMEFCMLVKSMMLGMHHCSL